MGNVSNRNGRALEYKIVDFLCSKESQFKVKLMPQAKSDLKRDKVNYGKLPKELKESYIKCAEVVHSWLTKEAQCKDLRLDKLTDSQAKEGDVTDIRITVNDRIINLSVKHHHAALKHQRPPTTAQRCGYKKGSKEDLAFRKKYKAIICEFLNSAKKHCPNAKNFRDLLTGDGDFINDNLYAPICSLVTQTINELCKHESNAKALFKFLVGTTSFYKVIDYDDRVLIRDFNSIGSPDSVVAKVEGKSYVYLTFSNGWILSLRLHTASSRLGSSLKFDTQAVSTPKAKEIIVSKLA